MSRRIDLSEARFRAAPACPDCRQPVGTYHAGLCPRNSADRYLTLRITAEEVAS